MKNETDDDSKIAAFYSDKVQTQDPVTKNKTKKYCLSEKTSIRYSDSKFHSSKHEKYNLKKKKKGN